MRGVCQGDALYPKLRVGKTRRCASRLRAGSHIALHGGLTHLQGHRVRRERLIWSRLLIREASISARAEPALQHAVRGSSAIKLEGYTAGTFTTDMPHMRIISLPKITSYAAV